MNHLTLSPALGWPVGGAVAVVLLACAIAQIVLHVRRRADSDETVWACVRRVLLCLTVSVMALTPSIVAPTNSRAVNATDVVVAVDVTGSMAVKDAQYGSAEQSSRLDVAKQAVKDVTALYPNSSFAALRFGASGTLDVPLTPDFERDRQLGGYTRARGDFRFGRFDVGCPYRPAAADLQVHS